MPKTRTKRKNKKSKKKTKMRRKKTNPETANIYIVHRWYDWNVA